MHLNLTLFGIFIAVARCANTWENITLVSFGDSLTDTGNTFQLTEHSWPSSPPYFNGRFSNGPSWIEQLSSSLKSQVHDFSYGGAAFLAKGFTGPHSNISVPSIGAQIDLYLASPRSKDFTTDKVYVVFAGLNDYYFEPSLSPSAVTQELVKKLVYLVEKTSPRCFMVPSLPDVSRMPFLQFNSTVKNGFMAKVKEHNRLLLERLTAFALEFPAIRIIQPDFESLIANIVGNGSAYGFKTLNRGFIRGYAGTAPSTTETRSVDEFLYFDEFHFTAKAQSLMAKAAQEKMTEAR